MNEQKPLEPWQWPEEHWRKLVNQVRAGRALRLRDLVRLRSRDQRVARGRQVDRPDGVGPVR